MEEQPVVALNYDVGQSQQLYRWAGTSQEIENYYFLIYHIMKKFKMKYRAG